MPRTLNEAEFNAIKAKVLESMPDGLDEASFNRQIGPRWEAAIAEAENSPAPLMGGSLRRAVSGAASMLNPIEMGKGLANFVTDIPGSLQRAGQAQLDQFGKAANDFGQGRYFEAAGHGLAGVVPLAGPAAANIGENIAQTGDVATGVGQGLGMIAPMLIAPGVKAAGKVAGKVVPKGLKTAAADALDASAAGKITDVMAPKVGANKVRFGNNAEAVAPKLAQDLAKDGAPFTRTGLADQVGSKLAEAQRQLDAVSDARLSARSFETKPLIDALLEKRRALTAEAVDASTPAQAVTERTSPLLDEFGKPAVTTSKTAVPIGKDVVPGPNAPRVAVIDQAIDELRQLGPVTRYEPIRQIRQAYDGPANAKYNSAVTNDYMKMQGQANGAADVTGTLRETLAQWDPETAKANAQYSLYRKADDVLQATAEVERTRPRVGRQIAARMGGTLIGAETGGWAGATAGYLLAPIIDAAMTSGATTQLQTAKLMTQLSNAIRTGNVSRVYSLTDQLKRGVKAVTRVAVQSSRPLSIPASSAAEATATGQ